MPTNTHPFLIGITGGSCSGKTTLSTKLAAHLGSNRAIVLSHDNYYQDQSHLTPSQRALTNYDHPSAYDTRPLISHLTQLQANQPVNSPIYDFENDTRSSTTIKIVPHPYIIVEGILIFADPKLKKLFDLTIFVDTDPNLRLHRRLRRDTREFHRSPDYVLVKYQSQVLPAYDTFVAPHRDICHLCLSGQDPFSVTYPLIMPHLP